MYVAGEGDVAGVASCYGGVAVEANWAPRTADSSASRKERVWVRPNGEPLATTRAARDILDATLAKGEGVLFFDACPANTGEVSEGKFWKPDAEYHTHSCREVSDGTLLKPMCIVSSAHREEPSVPIRAATCARTIRTPRGCCEQHWDSTTPSM